MSTRRVGTVSVPALVMVMAFIAAPTWLGCGNKKDTEPAQKPCCDQPTIPAGVAQFRVVKDDVSGRSDELKVLIRVGLAQPVKRDAVYPVLHLLYRWAMTRTSLEPLQVEAAVYPDEASAAEGGDAKMIARIARSQSDLGPRCDNRVPYDLSEQVERAFYAAPGAVGGESIDDTCRLAARKKTARIDEGFTHKPSYKLDAGARAVEVTYPYLVMGKDEYDKTLTFNSAMMAWSEVVARMFENVPDLKQVAFQGVLDDAPVLKIALTREQFDATNRSLRETIAAHRGITFQQVGMRRMNDAQAVKEEKAFQSKTYRESLAKLPRSQVTISPKLK
jgi:hypothetical protein